MPIAVRNPIQRPAPTCDDIDRRLIARLAAEARASNKDLARELGISESTVGSRLRRLRDDRLLQATVMVDWELAGYAASGFAFVRVEGSSTALTEGLAGHREVKSIVRTVGTSDVVVHLLAENASRLRAAVDDVDGGSGAASIGVAVVVEFHRLAPETVMLPVAQWTPAELPRPAIALDDLDHRLIEALTEDGHQSNREVARRLAVNESTIRGRLRRLEEARFLRVVAMPDRFALGEAVGGYLGIRVRGSERGEVIARLLERDDVPAVATTIGVYDLVAFLVDRTAADLSAAVDEIRALAGVRAVDVSLMTDHVFHRAHLTRFLSNVPDGI